MKKVSRAKSQKLGADFEKVVKDFFVWLFEEIGFVVTKSRLQEGGSQHGFDILIVVTHHYTEKKIFIECKNYSNDLDIGNIIKKEWDLEKNYYPTEEDLFLAINPRSRFSNEDNDEKASALRNKVFRIKSYLLDIDNRIKELFALNREFYFAIYNEEPNFYIDHEKEINRFKNYIFSKKPFKKIVLRTEDKEKYLTKIQKNMNYVLRSFSVDVDKAKKTYSVRNELKYTLAEITAKENRIIILGNPGLGKSTELKELALSMWKEGEQDIFPIYKNLRNFTSSCQLETYLDINLTEYSSYFIVLDGIDEIRDIEDFLSKFEEYVRKTSKHSNYIKWVLSCRTNVYESYVKRIDDFKVYFLNDLSLEEGMILLNTITQRENDNLPNEYYTFLANPFLIEVLAKYIQSHSTYPQNKKILWENYISERLSSDENVKFKKLHLNINQIKKNSSKISLINELMHANTISDENLNEVVPDGQLSEFKINPLIERELNNGGWYFEHRNIQEYFAADMLSKKSAEIVINFIQIADTGKTHPLLFNTITFLLNILETKRSEPIFEFLIENEPEMIFNTDVERVLLKHRIQAFQKYFKSICIDNTFWIGHNRNFDIKKIARYGDCIENFKYLLEVLNNRDYHFRTIISGYRLLANMKCYDELRSAVKGTFEDRLKYVNNNSQENGDKIKSEILNCLYSWGFHLNNIQYIQRIIRIFKHNDDREINSRILNMIYDQSVIDPFFDYIYQEFRRIYRIIPRKKVDNVIYSNYTINNLVLRIENQKYFLKILYYFFDEDDIRFNHSNDDIDNFFERCVYFICKDDSFILEILALITKRKYWFIRDQFIIRLIKESNTQLLVLNTFFHRNINIDNGLRAIVGLFDYGNIDIVINKFKDDLQNQNIVYIRNILSYQVETQDLAYYFEKSMRNHGTTFQENLLTLEQIENQKINYIRNQKENFNMLFHKEILIEGIRRIYDEIGKDEIDWITICDYNHQNRNYENPSSIILRRLISKRESLSFEAVKIMIENNDNFRLSEIRNQIEHIEINNKSYVVSKFHEEYILNWCLHAFGLINFEKVIETDSEGEIRTFGNFNIINLICFFQKYFGFDFNQEFYIKSLQYSDFTNHGIQFDYIKTKINNKEIFDSLVINNISSKSLNYFTLKSHIIYALGNQLTDSYKYIEEAVLEDENLYNQDRILEKLYIEINDMNFLRKCCKSNNSGLCWAAAKILLDNLPTETEVDEKSFLIDLAIEHLRSPVQDYYMKALDILFKFNHEDAFKYFYNGIAENKDIAVNFDCFKNYSNEIGISNIAKTYSVLYANESFDNHELHSAREIFRTYLINLSTNDMHFNLVKEKLSSIKDNLSKAKKELLIINLLIQECHTSNINSKSIPLSFEDARRKVEEISN